MNRMRGYFLLFLVGMVAWLSPVRAQESAAPLSQSQLTDAIKAGGLSADELSAIIRRRGLDFEMSADLERHFRDAGAGASVVQALWEKEQWTPPKGEALTKDFLTALLQTGTSPPRLSKWITVRKVNFELTPGTAKDLQTAGASDEVLALVSTNNLWVPPPPPPKATYEEVLAKAQAAQKGGNYDVAETLANTAKQMDTSRPEAFALIGYIYLYHFDSFSKAASEYRSAIEKNGEVEFRVRHVDHVSKLGKAETTPGQLILKKGSLVFRSSRADINLTLRGNQIVEVRLSGASAKDPLAKSAVHLLVSEGGGKPSEIVFHADRNKNDKDEETIIANLVNVIRQ